MYLVGDDPPPNLPVIALTVLYCIALAVSRPNPPASPIGTMTPGTSPHSARYGGYVFLFEQKTQAGFS